MVAVAIDVVVGRVHEVACSGDTPFVVEVLEDVKIVGIEEASVDNAYPQALAHKASLMQFDTVQLPNLRIAVSVPV